MLTPEEKAWLEEQEQADAEDQQRLIDRGRESSDPWAAVNRPPGTFPLTCGGRVIGYAVGLANGNIKATVTDMATARALSGPRVQVSVDMRVLPDE